MELTRTRPCQLCQSYRVSWDPAFPNQCLQFGVKSREVPSLVVLRMTGVPCPVFKIRPNVRPPQSGAN